MRGERWRRSPCLRRWRDVIGSWLCVRRNARRFVALVAVGPVAADEGVVFKVSGLRKTLGEQFQNVQNNNADVVDNYCNLSVLTTM